MTKRIDPSRDSRKKPKISLGDIDHTPKRPRGPNTPEQQQAELERQELRVSGAKSIQLQGFSNAELPSFPTGCTDPLLIDAYFNELCKLTHNMLLESLSKIDDEKYKIKVLYGLTRSLADRSPNIKYDLVQYYPPEELEEAKDNTLGIDFEALRQKD